MNSFFLHLLYIGLFLFSNGGIVDSVLMNWLDFLFFIIIIILIIITIIIIIIIIIIIVIIIK